MQKNKKIVPKALVKMKVFPNLNIPEKPDFYTIFDEDKIIKK